MATFTQNLNLRKPATNDVVDVTADLSANMDTIDTAVAGKAATGHTHGGTLDANARVAVKKTGMVVGTRRGVNLVEGTNISLTVVDDAANEEVDVTINATGGGITTYATTTELADVGAVESAGTTATSARGDHVHYHGTGYLPDAHHAQIHSDADHSGANKVAVRIGGVAVGTRNTVNLIQGNAIMVTGVDDAGNGEVDLTIASVPQVVTLNSSPGTAAAIPAAVTEGIVGTASTARRCKVDLSNATQARLSIRVSTASSSGAKWAVQLSADESTWKYLQGTASGSAPSADDFVAGNAVATATTGWVTLGAGLNADVTARIVSLDGDGATTGAVGQVTLQVR